MKALAKQLTQAAKVPRSFSMVVKPAKHLQIVQVVIKTGEAVYVRKEKP